MSQYKDFWVESFSCGAVGIKLPFLGKIGNNALLKFSELFAAVDEFPEFGTKRGKAKTKEKPDKMLALPAPGNPGIDI